MQCDVQLIQDKGTTMQIFYVEANSQVHNELTSNGWTTLSVLEINGVRIARIARSLSFGIVFK